MKYCCKFYFLDRHFFFKFLILTCLFKKISASLRNMSCNFCFTSFQSTWDEDVVRRPSVVVNFSHLRNAERNLPKLDRKQLQYHRTWPPIQVSLSLSLLVFYVTCNDISVKMWCHRCEGGLKKNLYLRSGSQRHRHFVGFFNVPVPSRHGTTLFIRWFRHTAPFSRLLRHAGDTEDVFST